MEDVLSGEVRGGPLEDLILHLQATFLPPKLREFLLLHGGQPPITAAGLVGFGPSQPVTSGLGVVRPGLRADGGHCE